MRTVGGGGEGPTDGGWYLEREEVERAMTTTSTPGRCGDSGQGGGGGGVLNGRVLGEGGGGL
jgi:hypothetical protein